MSENNKPLIATGHGYILPDTEIWIDPLEPVRTAVISHAHGDHAVPGHAKVYCTKNTARLLRARFRQFAGLVITPEYNETFDVDGVPFMFVPAGHMLGSAQVIWDRNGKRHNYTGDYKRQQDPTCEPFQVIKSDVLITETTFAQKGKTHPPAGESILVLGNNNNTNYVIGAYTLGKAQRLIYLINQLLPEMKVMVHPKISRYNKIYEEAGFNLGDWSVYHRQIFKKNTGCIYIIPPSVLQSYMPGTDFLRGMASGWDRLQAGMDIVLPISDHADWNELILTITESEATEVYTIHGESEAIIEHYKNSSIQISEL